MAYSIFVGAGQWVGVVDDERAQGLFGFDADLWEWRPIDNGLPENLEVRYILVRPDRPATVYAGTHQGPYVSDDSGESWRALPLPAGTSAKDKVVWSICLDPSDAETIYVGTQGTTVFRSRNGGADWQRLLIEPPEGCLQANFPMRVIRIAVASHDPDDILVAFEVGGLVRSGDGGQSWTSCNKTLLELAKQPHLKSTILSDNDIEGMMDSHALALSPNHPGTVWLANRMGLFHSGDSGDDWSEFGIGRFSPLTYARDVIVSSHDPERMYAALSVAAMSDAGSLYRSDDFGTTWSRFDHDVSIDSTLMVVAESVSTPDRVYCAARRGQVFGTEDGGKSWQTYQLPHGVQGVYALACV
ncbi:MAG: hypothetical protein QGG19_01305 [Alphaproteobacteria bacterium]|jgi:photosystem II stability/assembly factor-like uncharacterized protein|nr:hypothetical protein [Rhodospirillaceae bacterium]MDP6019939.1 hypothetical protein [Alphaproteobacteria bacterium]MDP6253712.1 hypothetical protein [Alphaproteobacteria bacterium]MDP7055660.1 hypothetical protein [Alphaproteobacteria bacterium]MDP7229294.1 hypothetical protein [Alphaproteobacteria bacterium]|tara:strand:- start:4006 stop:5076 length:1071 start_codon:yes stop_codon:yes gene_type:complete